LQSLIPGAEIPNNAWLFTSAIDIKGVFTYWHNGGNGTKADACESMMRGREVPETDTGGFKVGRNLRPVSVIDPRRDQGSYRTKAVIHHQRFATDLMPFTQAITAGITTYTYNLLAIWGALLVWKLNPASGSI
jgi:hypothetical protein